MGIGKGYWNIDHIIPISNAKTEEELIELNHYTNLQPLWATKNYIKGKRKRYRIVLQYDTQGNFIKEWESTMDIQRQLKIFNTSISACCNGKAKTAGGYVWRYKDT